MPGILSEPRHQAVGVSAQRVEVGTAHVVFDRDVAIAALLPRLDRIDADAQRRKCVHQFARVGHHDFLAAAALIEREKFRVNFRDRHAIVAVGVADGGEEVANFGNRAQAIFDLRDYLDRYARASSPAACGC